MTYRHTYPTIPGPVRPHPIVPGRLRVIGDHEYIARELNRTYRSTFAAVRASRCPGVAVLRELRGLAPLKAGPFS